jgi:hypothetical protein
VRVNHCEVETAAARNRKASAKLFERLSEHHDFRMFIPTVVGKPKIVEAKAPKPVPISAISPDAIRAMYTHWTAISTRNRSALLTELTNIAESPIPTFKEILQEVSSHFDVSQLAIKSARRDAQVILPRQVACYLGKEETKMSLPAIGRQLGSRDHTTILHAAAKIARLIEEGHPIAGDVIEIRRRLHAQIETRMRLENEINADPSRRLASEAAAVAPSDIALEGAGSNREAVQHPQE